VPRKPLTVQEFASLGGKARAEKLSQAQLSQAGKKAARARWGKRKAKAKTK